MSESLPPDVIEVLAKSAAEVTRPVVEAGINFMSAVFGKPCRIASGMMVDQLYAWRWQNRVKIAARAQQILEESKVAAKVTPPSFLVPLIEAAGDVDDPELSELWAKLLAAGVESEKARHPMFIETLKRMNPADARQLEAVLCRRTTEDAIVMGDYSFEGVQAARASFQRLLALGLIRGGADLLVVGGGTEKYSVSPFGYQFLSAIAGPASKSDRSPQQSVDQ